MNTFDLYKFVYGKPSPPKKSAKIYPVYPHERLLWFREGGLGIYSTIRGMTVLRSSRADFKAGLVLAEYLDVPARRIAYIFGRNVEPIIVSPEEYFNDVEKLDPPSPIAPSFKLALLNNKKFTFIKHPTRNTLVVQIKDRLVELEVPGGTPVQLV